MHTATVHYLARPSRLRVALWVLWQALCVVGYFLLACYETLFLGRSVNDQMGRDQEELGT